MLYVFKIPFYDYVWFLVHIMKPKINKITNLSNMVYKSNVVLHCGDHTAINCNVTYSVKTKNNNYHQYSSY